MFTVLKFHVYFKKLSPQFCLILRWYVLAKIQFLNLLFLGFSEFTTYNLLLFQLFHGFGRKESSLLIDWLYLPRVIFLVVDRHREVHGRSIGKALNHTDSLKVFHKGRLVHLGGHRLAIETTIAIIYSFTLPWSITCSALSRQHELLLITIRTNLRPSKAPLPPKDRLLLLHKIRKVVDQFFLIRRWWRNQLLVWIEVVVFIQSVYEAAVSILVNILVHVS